ncbi:MAG: aminopeptidase [Clostridia bacterium]|nr:aminopeptidase [Clostridia bacterium]
MKYEKQLREYARITARIGANVQPGQYVVISSPLHAAGFAKMIQKEAFEAGAKDVKIDFHDEEAEKTRFSYADAETLSDLPEWFKEWRTYYARKGGAYIHIGGGDPEAFKGIDGAKMLAFSRAMNKASEEFYELMDQSVFPWCVVGYPSEAWAKKVFPDDKPAVAVDKLFKAIFKAVRIGRGDTAKKWRSHDRVLKRRAKILNGYDFKELRFKNGLGTDLRVGLVEHHIWQGGSDKTNKKVKYMPNMPTEEIFSMPDMNNVNGVVYSSMPLSYQGSLIEDFSLTFKDGAVVGHKAKKGDEVLARLLETDEGAKRLGEVALIPYESPISDMKILFYNTLYDENASCHLALGSSYAMTIKGGGKMSKEEAKAAGSNDSGIHVDFMFGTADMSVVGVTHDGRKITVFKDGNFVF